MTNNKKVCSFFYLPHALAFSGTVIQPYTTDYSLQCVLLGNSRFLLLSFGSRKGNKVLTHTGGLLWVAEVCCAG